MTTKGRAGVFGLAIAATLSATHLASADVKATLMPLVGAESTSSAGWLSFAARLENDGPETVRGTLELSGGDVDHTTTTVADFALAPGASAMVRLPSRPSMIGRTDLVVRDARGKTLASTGTEPRWRDGPMILELRTPPRLVPTLTGAEIAITYEPRSGHTGSPLGLAVAGAVFDPTTGDPVLPEQAAAYGAATVILAPSDLLSRLAGAELDALAGYVLGGGTLAIVVSRPEDLTSPTVAAFTGGTVRDAGVARQLARLKSPAIAKGKAPSPSYVPPEPIDDDDEPLAPPPKAKPEPPKPVTMVTPDASIRDQLALYAGGNLQTTDLGSSAPYGLGEVHLLPFDPDKSPFAEDPWVASRMAELTRHAWDRRAALVFPQGEAIGHASSASDVERQLDPNESSRWAIVVATMLLLAYSVMAAPISFSMATRAGKPLRALRHLPIFAAVTFLMVVALGLASKGIHGESRRLSLIEASGGMNRAIVRRYRALFTPSARSLTVPATDASGAPDLATNTDAPSQLRVERTGLRLEGVATKPWETVIVREEGLTQLGGGVSLTREAGDVRVTNRLGRDLRGLLVSVPGRGYYHVASLKDGASVLATTGTLVLSSPPGGLSPSGTHTHVRPLAIGRFEPYLEGDAPRLTAAWSALADAARARNVDWWPGESPVLLAQIDGGEGVLTDAGLRVGSDRTLLRVVGYGGSP